jgi:DNA-nicking Smr family endonuclease
LVGDRLDDDPADVVAVPIEQELDLHAFRPQDVAAVVDAFLTAAAEAGHDAVRLVHGRGIGVQRRIVHTTLASHGLVADFWDDPRSHLGATVARLRPPPSPQRA